MIAQTYISLAMHSGFILVGTLFVSWIFSFLCSKFSQKEDLRWWIRILFEQVAFPVQIMLWAGSLLTWYAYIIKEYEWLHFLPFMLIQKVIIVIPVFWASFRIKSALEIGILERAAQLQIDKTFISVLSKITTLVLCAFFVVTMLHVVGMPLQSLMVFGGAISIAVGLASKNVIENFFGGLMVYINRPFKVGNWISSPDKKIEGVVEEIGWYSTKIRTFDRRPMYVPNALFTNIIVQNPSRMYNRRIRCTVGLRYEDIDKLEAIVADIRSMLAQHEGIDQKQACMVHWVAFGDSSLDIDVYTFTSTVNWAQFRSVQQDVFLKIAAIVAFHKAEIAFPTKQVRLIHERNSEK